MKHEPTDPHAPSVRRAASGLGLVFASVALQALGLFALALVHSLLPAAWTFAVASVDAIAQVLLAAAILLDLTGRYLCHRAAASLAAKRWLRGSMLVGAVAFIGALIPPTWQALAWYGAVPAENVPPAWPTMLGVLAVLLLSHAAFLRYLRGLAEGQELPGFASDATAVLVIGLLAVPGVPAIAFGVVYLIWFIGDYFALFAVALSVLAVSAVPLFVILGYLWPLARYSRLLTHFREQLIRKVERPLEEHHANPHHNW
jgi:hypothetical protein